ncbi:MAG: hypothetical protein GY739_20365, partial [Mesoflavibacter sp.]|nr:hypothetical protein [Mesoflavibacter sp.]
MRAQILAHARKDILGHCSEMRMTGYYNHPSVEVVINQEDIHDAQGEIILNACMSLITVLARERYMGGFFQTSVYLSVMIRLKNQLLLNIQPSFDSGWYHWQAPERFIRGIAYDELDHSLKGGLDVSHATYAKLQSLVDILQLHMDEAETKCEQAWFVKEGKGPQTAEEVVAYEAMRDVQAMHCFDQMMLILQRIDHYWKKFPPAETGLAVKDRSNLLRWE